MTVPAALVLALGALAKNLLRSALAMVGLVIGVGAVVTMVALGRGAQEQVASEVSSAGTNLIYVRAGNYVRGGDAVAIPSGFGRSRTLLHRGRDRSRGAWKPCGRCPFRKGRRSCGTGDPRSRRCVHGHRSRERGPPGVGAVQQP